VTDKNKDPKRVAMRKAVLERGGCVVTFPIEGATRAGCWRRAHADALTRWACLPSIFATPLAAQTSTRCSSG